MKFSKLYSGHFVREQGVALSYGSNDLQYEIGMVRGLSGPFRLVLSHIASIEGIFFLEDIMTIFIKLRVIIKD